MNTVHFIEQVLGELGVELRQTAKYTTTRILSRKEYILKEKARPIDCHTFISMAEDYTLGLLGEINRFLVNIGHADSWFRVAQKHDNNERMSILCEFADPHFEISVGRPHSLRDQFVFASVHLLHQSGKLSNPRWRDRLPRDRDIKRKHLEELGLAWIGYKGFREAMDLLNDQEFVKLTLNYRNRLQHQFRIHFDFGLAPVVERTETDGRVIYAFKAIPPLNLKVLIPELYKQHQLAIEVFKAYWGLVDELLAEWDRQYLVRV